MYIYDMCKYTIHTYIYTLILTYGSIHVHTYARQSDREDRKQIDFHLAHLAVLYMIL